MFATNLGTEGKGYGNCGAWLPAFRMASKVIAAWLVTCSIGLWTAPSFTTASPSLSSFASGILLADVAFANSGCKSERAAVDAVRREYRDSHLRIVFANWYEKGTRKYGNPHFWVRVDDGNYVWDVAVTPECNVFLLD